MPELVLDPKLFPQCQFCGLHMLRFHQAFFCLRCDDRVAPPHASWVDRWGAEKREGEGYA